MGHVVIQQCIPEHFRIVPVALVDRSLRVHRCTHLKYQPSVHDVDNLLIRTFGSSVLVESVGDVVVYGALVSLLQLLHFRCRALGEELIERAEREVVDPEVDYPRSSHVLAPHGSAELISGLVADADDAVLGPDESGGFVDGGVFDDNAVTGMIGARRATDPDFLGQ